MSSNQYNIARPLSISDEGIAFESDPDVPAVVKQNFKNLLLTKKQERFFRRSYGCDLLNLLFEPKTDALKRSIAEEIVKATNIWLKFIKIDKIYVIYSEDQIPSDLPETVQEPNETEVLVIIKYSFTAGVDKILDTLSLTVTTYGEQ
jgi:phage baseplate assembly protein W